MNHIYSERYTVVFLLDSKTPSKIVLLKRAEWKKFAANMYTGIGGHIKPNEDHSVAAHRELKEETSIEGLNIVEFARCKIIESNKLLHYYWAVYNVESLPLCTEGALEWVSIKDVLKKNIIPTTWHVVNEWSQRNFDTKQTYTVNLHEVKSNGSLERSVENIEEGI